MGVFQTLVLKACHAGWLSQGNKAQLKAPACDPKTPGKTYSPAAPRPHSNIHFKGQQNHWMGKVEKTRLATKDQNK